MTLLRKYYDLIIDLPTGGGIPDEMRIEKAYQLLVKKSKEAYLSSGSFSASPFGLDGIPHVRRDAISKLMVEFSDSELSITSEEISRLKEENERLRGALSELYDVVYKGENVFKSLDKAHEVLNKPNITIVQSTPSPTKK